MHLTPLNVLIAARQTLTFFLTMTDEKDMDEDIDIKQLARAHAIAAIDVLAEIMNNADAPASARISAAKTLLDRGFGKGEERPARRDKSVQWTDLSDERRELGRAAGPSPPALEKRRAGEAGAARHMTPPNLLDAGIRACEFNHFNP